MGPPKLMNCLLVLFLAFAATIPMFTATVDISGETQHKQIEKARNTTVKVYQNLKNGATLKINYSQKNATLKAHKSLKDANLKTHQSQMKNVTLKIQDSYKNATLKAHQSQKNGTTIKTHQSLKNVTLKAHKSKKKATHDVKHSQKRNDTTLKSHKSHLPNSYKHIIKDINGKKSNGTKLVKILDLASNGTRRILARRGRYSGPCKPTNPIDRCWRCRPDWHLNRKKLADCPIGFGHQTTGGKMGKIYIVTDPSDDDVIDPKPGTLRYAVIQKKPLWIIFARSMTITLKQELIMESHKTIDGRGAKVHIAYGAGITIQFVKNIIIHNIYIHDIVVTNGGMIRDSVDHVGFRTVSDGDGINIFGAQQIWLDHLSMYKCADGIIDAIEGSTDITISNCHWTDHDKVLLFGARDTNTADESMRITVIYNHFGKRLIQRMPRVRSGVVHVVNNDYTHWEMYAIGGSHHATIVSQGNRFIATSRPEFKQVTHRDAPESEWRKWLWASQGDIFMRGAFFVESGDQSGVLRLRGLVKPQPARTVKSLTRFTGVIGGCRPGIPC